MPFAIGGNARIRTNTPAENAYNALDTSNRDISVRQLRLSTGKRINNASDDVSGYITSRALTARNNSLKTAINAVGDASNVSYIIMDALESINTLLQQIKESASYAASGASGTDEKIALANAAYRMAEQIQTAVDSTVFGGRQLLDGSFSANFIIGSNAANSLLTVNIDLTEANNIGYNVDAPFNLNSMSALSFGGVTGLNLSVFKDVKKEDMGAFASDQFQTTLQSLSLAINNVNKVASYVGGIVNRLVSQEDLLKGQVSNYNAAISRIQDADVAKEQLELIKSQFLQQASLVSLTQANTNPKAFLQLIQG